MTLQESILAMCGPTDCGGHAEAVLDFLFEGHRAAARDNDNLSKILCAEACRGGLSFPQGTIAALASMGGVHAPVTQARVVYASMGDREIVAGLAMGRRVPGFGNSFHKADIDPAWLGFYNEICRKRIPSAGARLDHLAWLLEKAGHDLAPNAAAFTAVAADAIGLPWGVESLLVIMPRLPVWAQHCAPLLANIKPLIERKLTWEQD